jgi:putative colanic acid biosynthesis UDP-glucose lipid carrier transferase
MIANSQTHTYTTANTEISDKSFLSYIEKKTGYFLQKRIFDIAFSIVVIIFLLSWLIPLIAIAIKLNSRGPVFFIQRRTGRGLRSFLCIKFRTMVPNGQADKFVPHENDRRVTSLGRFLRKTSLDELPQFINVLIGDMSIVGPRPHMPADCNRFSEFVDGYKFRNLVRPGITGLAQIKGFRGPAEDPDSIIFRFYYDSVYIRNLNFKNDIRIIHKTGLQVISFIFSKRSLKKNNMKNKAFSRAAA